jgi:hypothetical protein
MLKIKAEQFIDRKELDRHVELLEEKNNVVISGTQEEMHRLGLSSTTTVWGVKCEIVEGKTAHSKKVQRGKKPKQIRKKKLTISKKK